MHYNKRVTIVILITSLIFFYQSGFAGDDIVYPTSTIPDSLKKSANAVIRFEETIFELKGIDKATVQLHEVVTILNKNALFLTYFVKPYDQFSKVKNIKGAVYDAEGKLVKKIKQDDIKDISANFGGSLFVDSRIKVVDLEYLKYPFTVEYSCEIDFDGLLNYPDWQIFENYNVSIQNSVFKVIRPGHLDIRTYFKDIDFKPEENIDEGKVILTWQIQNIKAISEEPFSMDLANISPAIKLAPTDFLIDGFQGNAETWENFGKWIYTLNEGKRDLSPESNQKILNLISDKNSDLEKAQFLYKYMQDKTRYVSVQVGIGGWQPIEADQVDRLSYGDCKALTNYMKALLDVAGIPSYYTLVKAGRNSSDIIEDFPSNQFNHAILCTVIDSDTVWLECTSQRLPFGYLGSFTDDRDVVLINENGGHLVHTKSYDFNENQKICNSNIEIDADGNGITSISTRNKGYFYDKELQVLLSDDHDQEKMIRENLHLPNFELKSYNLEEKQEIVPSIEENLELNIDRYGTKFGNRMAINLNLLNKMENIPPKKEKRRSEIVVKRSFVENDTIIYVIPEEYIVEKTSKNRNIKSAFGEFTTYTSVNESAILYIRHLKVNKGIYSADQYNDFYDFYQEIKQGDEDRVILVAN